MLKFYVDMGLKVRKLHRVIYFKQDYIYRESNTNKRATAKIEAEKDTRKLKKNSLFGRTGMNHLHFNQPNFLHDEDKMMKSLSNPIFKSMTRYDDSAHLQYIKKGAEYKSTIYLGTTVLELSRLHMYLFYYKILKPSQVLQLHYMGRQFHIKFY